MPSFLSRTMCCAAGQSVLALLLNGFLTSQVYGQVIERNPPPAPTRSTTAIATPNAVPAEEDSTPIGPNLRALVLLNGDEAAHSAAPDGISMNTVPRLRDTKVQAAITAELNAYMGKPMSRKLIADIEATIAKQYRAVNYPFVSLSTPEQAIDGGMLQIRIVEFTLGAVAIHGADDSEAASIRKRIGLGAGQPINSSDLIEDIDWINRYPFRQVQAVFSPGESTGTSDLSLMATQTKPWQVYGGYANSGTTSTSRDRLFVGGAVGDLLGQDSTLLFQSTVSPNRLSNNDFPDYESYSVGYTLPVGVRGQIEAGGDLVKTNQTVNPFIDSLEVLEGNLGYRFGVPSPFGAAGLSDMRVGVEANHQTRTLYFGDTNVLETPLNVYQLYLGFHYTGSDAPQADALDLSLHFSPGDIDSQNSDSQARLYSLGRVSNMTYGYLNMTYDRWTQLPAELALKTEVIGQYAPSELPQSQQQGLGAASLVRGYSLDNGGYDTALVLRNELHFPSPTHSPEFQLDPYLFGDYGYGRDNFYREDTTLGSVGIGANANLLSHLAVKVDAATALAKSNDVQPGDIFVHVNVVATF